MRLIHGRRRGLLGGGTKQDSREERAKKMYPHFSKCEGTSKQISTNYWWRSRKVTRGQRHWQVHVCLLSDMGSQFTAAWACWHVDLNNAAVQWGGAWKHDPNRLFRYHYTWQESTRVGGVEIQSLVVQNKDCLLYRSKDHFHWIHLYPLNPAGPKSGGHCPPTPQVAPPLVLSVVVLNQVLT